MINARFAVFFTWLASLGLMNSANADQNWNRSVENPVLAGNGEDIIQASDPCVIYDSGKYRMWFASVGTNPDFASVGYAESNDGDFWTNPVIVFSPNVPGSWDDQTVDIPYVLKDDNETDPAKRYKMWYGGSNSATPNITKIGFAYSKDGMTWNRLSAEQSLNASEGLIMEAEDSGPGDYAIVGEPTIVKKEETFHMWYNSWGDSSIVISYAFSLDGINWTKHSNNPVLTYTKGSWEVETQNPEVKGTVVQPTVLWDDENSLYMMWYGSFDSSDYNTYSGIGFATSEDGINWKKNKEPVFVLDYISLGETRAISSGPFILKQGSLYHLWYTGVTDRRVINHATSSFNLTRVIKTRSSFCGTTPRTEILNLCYGDRRNDIYLDIHYRSSLRIYNLSGELLRSINNLNNFDVILDVGQYHSGGYIVEIVSKKKSATRLILVK